MTALTAPAARPPAVSDVLALQFANRYRRLGVPLIIFAVVVLISVLIAIGLMQVRVEGPGESFGTGTNLGALWALGGFHVALGVQGVSSSFPFALALGSTRSTFVFGNLATSVVQSIYVAVVAVALLGVEVATGGFFIGARLLRIEMLGDGNAPLLFGIVALTLLTALSIGGVFGSAWTRFGAKGAAALGLAMGIVLAVAFALFLRPLTDLLQGFQPWWLAAAAIGVIAASTLGGYLFLRGASVR